MNGRKLTVASVSAMVLTVAAVMMPANADVNLGTCQASDCIWLVVDDVVVRMRSLTEDEEATGQVINLPVPPRLEGPAAGQGVGLLDANGKLTDFAYFDSTGTNIVFQSQGESTLTVPLGVTLINLIPETGRPQLIFSIPTSDGGLARIYVQSDIDIVPEPAYYLNLLAGLGLLVMVGRQHKDRSRSTR